MEATQEKETFYINLESTVGCEDLSQEDCQEFLRLLDAEFPTLDFEQGAKVDMNQNSEEARQLFADLPEARWLQFVYWAFEMEV